MKHACDNEQAGLSPHCQWRDAEWLLDHFGINYLKNASCENNLVLSRRQGFDSQLHPELAMNYNTLNVWGDGGVPSIAPFQTKRSLVAALDIGVHGLVIYVRRCQTGELVLHKEETIDPISYGQVHRGFLKYFTLQSLKEIDFGGEEILTLDEAIELVNGRVVLNVVLCSDDGLSSLIASFRLAHQAKGVSYNRLMFSSHDQHQVARFSRDLPRVETGVIMSGIPLDYLQSVQTLQSSYVFLDAKSARERMMRDAEARNIRVFVTGDLNQSEINLLRDSGLYGIVSTFPQLLIPQQGVEQQCSVA